MNVRQKPYFMKNIASTKTNKYFWILLLNGSYFIVKNIITKFINIKIDNTTAGNLFNCTTINEYMNFFIIDTRINLT